MAPFKHRLEHGTIQRRKPGQPWKEPKPIGDAATARSGLDDPLVLPQSLSEKRRSLEEAPAGLDFCERQVVIIDWDEARNEEPAAKQPFARPPSGGQIADARREGHPQERTKLTVDATGTYGVAPKGLGFCRQAG